MVWKKHGTSYLDIGDKSCTLNNDRNLYGPVSREPRGTGIWSGYGVLPAEHEGIYLKLKNSFNLADMGDAEEAAVKPYSIVLGIKDVTRKLHKNTITLTAGDETEVINIGEPERAHIPLLVSSEGASAEQASAWNITTGDRLFSSGVKLRIKHTSALLSDFSEPNPNIPNWNNGGSYDIQAFFNVDKWDQLSPSSESFENDQIGNSSDFANAICYYINNKWFKDRQNYKWKASVRNVDNSDTAVGLSSPNRLTDPNFEVPSLLGALIDIEYLGEVDPDNPPSIKVGRYEKPLSGASPRNGFDLIDSSGNAIDWDGSETNFVEKTKTGGRLFVEGEAGSLRDLCGFENATSRVGDIAKKKALEEAIVMIPFVDNAIDSETVASTREIDGKNFFKVSGGLLDSDDAGDSIKNLNTLGPKYNIPPAYGFLNNSDIDPFVMYVFEFSEDLDQQDLADIWQGLMPRCARKATKSKQIIEHPLDEFNFFEGKTLPTAQDNEMKWMIFKVKRKANNNYYKLTPDSNDDEDFKFTIGGENDIIPKYSYNWPYDYCSLVEMANVKGGIVIEKKEED